MLDRLFAPFDGVGELILRLALGIVFLAHGLPKLKNPSEMSGLLTKLGIPAASLLAWLVALKTLFPSPRHMLVQHALRAFPIPTPWKSGSVTVRCSR